MSAPRVAPEGLRERLVALEATYDRRFLDSDPVGIVRRFERAEDRELVGLLAAALAYGRVASIRASLEKLLRIMGPRPSRFLEGFAPVDATRFDGFAHRFTLGRDIAVFLWLLRQARDRPGGLERFFLDGDGDDTAVTLERAMESFASRLFALDARPLLRSARLDAVDPVRWLLTSPSGGSVCKRHCLFLRWMVRRDDGVDCGVWEDVPPARLLVPLDVHLQRVATALGWTRRKSASWRMTLEVTAAMRALDPIDPLRFDFALCRLGILGRLRPERGRVGRTALLRAIDEAMSPAPSGEGG